jgi:ribokinase
MRSSELPGVKVAVVGHVEWVQFGCVEHVPSAGEVVHGEDCFEQPAGGGAVAAVQLARLAGSSLLLTALGNDELGPRSVAQLGQLGVRTCPAWRKTRTRRAVTLLDRRGERTITTFGERLEPTVKDELPWGDLNGMDAVYFTAGDVGALKAARGARVLVATPRAYDALGHGVLLDALVFSANDAIERREAPRAKEEARLTVFTEGDKGGRYETQDGRSGSWKAVAPCKDIVDSYGCGDSFAAGLTFALGSGFSIDDSLALAARCGAACLTGRGPYEGQLTAAKLAAPAVPLS